MAELKRTPLYDEHLTLGAKMVDFAGWEMPIEYSGITNEHLSVRNNCGLFDVSHMGEIFISGPDSEAYIQKLVTGDVTKIVDNQIMYTMMCYEHGGIVDDLLVYKFNQENYLLVVNASNTLKDYEWIVKHCDDYRVVIQDKSVKYGQVALQGHNAEKILQQFTTYDLSSLKYFYFDLFKVCDEDCLVSRTGYTGEDGFEIYSSRESIVKIWRALINAGALPVGLGARDTLRFEAGMPLYGNEISESISPLEAGLGYFVKLDTDFIGKEALLKQKEEGLKRKLVGLELQRKGICRHGYPVFNLEEIEIGVITTGYLLPERELCVALALINSEEAVLGNDVLVNIRNKLFEAKVINKKFLNKNK